jgi:hypothetical protein
LVVMWQHIVQCIGCVWCAEADRHFKLDKINIKCICW